MHVPFAAIEEVAIARVGCKSRLLGLLYDGIIQPQQIEALSGSFLLSEMTKTIFQMGFNWGAVRRKWPGFESAFWGFSVERCANISESDLVELCKDERIIRNLKKVSSVRENAGMILEGDKSHSSFAKLLANWPNDDFVGLLEYLGTHGSMLGAKTAQYFLRHIGRDGFLINMAGVAALKKFNVVDRAPTTISHLKNIQQAFNGWTDETGYGLAKLSQILALSVEDEKGPKQKIR